jgi:hypothetical protein
MRVERTPKTNTPSDRRSRAAAACQYRSAIAREMTLGPAEFSLRMAMLALLLVFIIVHTNYRSPANESIRKHAPNHFVFFHFAAFLRGPVAAPGAGRRGV